MAFCARRIVGGYFEKSRYPLWSVFFGGLNLRIQKRGASLDLAVFEELPVWSWCQSECSSGKLRAIRGQ